jgi:hypothetical protein
MRPDRRIFAHVGPMAPQVVCVQITPLGRLLGSGQGPRLYVEPAGQGDSDKARDMCVATTHPSRTR